MLLSTLLLIPLAGAGLILLLRAGALRAVRAVAVLASGATLLLACVLLGLFDPSDSGIQFFESHRWNPRFGTAFSLGLDGISLPLVLLAALLGYARIYLSQHFLQDVVVGSLLGVAFAALMYHILFRSRWSTAEWLNRRPFLKGGSGAAQRSPS